MAPDNGKRKRDNPYDERDHASVIADDAPAKKPRAYTREDAEFAKIYEDLANEVGKTRFDATSALLAKLSSNPAPEPDTFAKILKRLIRGLCSSRKAARSGFFIALTEFLQLSTLKLPEDRSENRLGFVVQQYVDDGTTTEVKASNQEKRDYAIGCMLAYQAMIESRFVFNAHDSSALWKTTLQNVFSQAKATRWLREEYCSVVNNCIPFLTEQRGMTSFINEILSTMVEQKLENTPEGIALWLTAQTSGSKLSYPENRWRKNDPFNKHERAKVLRIMKGGGDELPNANGSTKSRVSGNQTRLGFAWNVLVLSFADRLKDTSSKRESKRERKFKAFWKELVDDILFAESASPERKSLGLQLLVSAIGTCPSWAIPLLFSSNLMRCIVNHRSDSKRLLHDAAKAPLDKIKDRVRSEPEIGVSVIKAIITSSQTVNFDGMTKTKTLGDLMREMHTKFIPDVLELIDGLVVKPNSYHAEASDADAIRQGLADMLLGITRGRRLDLDDDWTTLILQMLLKYSYFDWKSGSHVKMSNKSRAAFRSRLTSCLNNMISSESNASSICFAVVSTLKNMLNDKDHTALLQADDGIQYSLDQAIDTVISMKHKVSLDTTKGNQSPMSNAFACLYTMTILRVYNEEADAVPMLAEIDTAYKAVTDSKDSVKEAFDLLVEVLLGMVSKQSALSRKLAEQAFSVVAPHLTPSALQSMLDVLAQKENAAGQHVLFENENENEDGADDDAISELDSDAEEVNEGPLANGNDEFEDEAGSSASGEEPDENDDVGEGDEEEMERLDASLGDILKTGRSGPDEEATDDESMDDEQMIALEPSLTKIFQEQKKVNSKKKENKDAKETVINFKNRVLDLLAIYIKQQHSNLLVLDLIIPLLWLISDSTSKQVSEKTNNILGNFFDLCSKKKEGLPKPRDPEKIWALLETLMKEVARNNSKLYQSACSRSSVFLVKVLIYMEEDTKGPNAKQTLARAQDLYSGLQKQWMVDSKLEIQASFFINWVGWCSDMRKIK